MFESEQKTVTELILKYFDENQIPVSGEIQWSPIPFSGNWGISTSFFQTAAAEARTGKQVKVPVRAQEIAEGVRNYLGDSKGFERVEAVRGYLNLYFSTAEYSRRVIRDVAKQGDDFGRGAPKGHQVMVEFSQPNTHKAFHVGHLRSAILGDVVCRI
nr:arginine--tRNA ligase [Phycisphaerae bacterium]NIP56366.1 arginine--tRNA ligase [Phycisphaerae bacterium]NIW44125.1 arginine--tRNA ligase [Gammaproteobacteria bacterium]NIX32704.1 arginine--tRNA ligase [Phycisphaerae bacterium]